MNAPIAAPALQAKDFKSDYKPVWCPGCGDYSVLTGVTKALAILGLRPENVAVVSGIGCSSRIPAYTTCYGFHGVHGRSLPAATGLKALVSLHDTTLGAGLGGTRALSTYETEADAVDDVLRLSRGMTYKAALAGLPHGGGKAVIMLPKGPFDRAALFTALNPSVDLLGENRAIKFSPGTGRSGGLVAT